MPKSACIDRARQIRSVQKKLAEHRRPAGLTDQRELRQPDETHDALYVQAETVCPQPWKASVTLRRRPTAPRKAGRSGARSRAADAHGVNPATARALALRRSPAPRLLLVRRRTSCWRTTPPACARRPRRWRWSCCAFFAVALGGGAGRQFPRALGRRTGALVGPGGAVCLERAGRRPAAGTRGDRGLGSLEPGGRLLPLLHQGRPYVEVSRGRAPARRRRGPPAAPTRMRAGALRSPLPPAAAVASCPRCCWPRRTWRRFARAPAGAGRAGHPARPDLRRAGLDGHPGAGPRWPSKTSPSGGARHSIEAYVLARRVNGLAPGLYHYAADRHGLERLPRARRAAQIAAYLPHAVAGTGTRRRWC